MSEAAPLEQIYDEETLAALDTWRPGTGDEPRRGPGRSGLAGLVLTGMALGLREALEGEADEEPVVELRPDPGLLGPQWVTFVHVPGAPQASRLVIRPWLAPR